MFLSLSWPTLPNFWLTCLRGCSKKIYFFSGKVDEKNTVRYLLIKTLLVLLLSQSQVNKTTDWKFSRILSSIDVIPTNLKILNSMYTLFVRVRVHEYWKKISSCRRGTWLTKCSVKIMKVSTPIYISSSWHRGSLFVFYYLENDSVFLIKITNRFPS